MPLDKKEDVTEIFGEIVTDVDGEQALVTRWAAVVEYIDIETNQKGLCYLLSPECTTWDGKTLFEVGQGVMISKMNKGGF